MINNYLPEKHISLTAVSDVREICAPLCQHSLIKLFFYNQMYDNKIHVLGTHTEWHQYFWNHYNKFIGNNERYCAQILNRAQKQLPLLTLKESVAAHDAEKYFELVDFIQFFIKIDGGYEEIGFATTKGNSIINFCINNQERLYKFSLYFKERAHKLIQKTSQEGIDISGLISDNSLTNFSESHETPEFELKNYPFYYKNKTYFLTPREFESLKYLTMGYSYKTIANLLNISPKTIEFHIKNIKDKLGIYSKQKLVENFQNNAISCLS